MRSVDWYKKKINEKIIEFNEFNDNYKVYGGVTEQPLKSRFTQHINEYTNDNKKEPITKDWKYFNKKAITSIKIKKENKQKYKELISDVEQHLIKSLDKHFKCVNKHKKDGTPKQTGGAGLQLDEDDVIKFYIIYGP